MLLDPLTQAIMTALVVVVAGVMFISETLLRRDEGAGRVWALAYLAAMLTTVSYLAWAASPSMWWAVAVGNMTFVAGTGLMWLGCVRYNGRLSPLYSGIVTAGALAAFITVLVKGPDGGAWAGAEVMFIGIALFAGAGAVETLRGAMGKNLNARTLAFVLGIQAIYYVVRAVAFFMMGSESVEFSRWFGTEVTSYLTVTLTITAVITTSVLRADRARLRGHTESSMVGFTSEGVLMDSPLKRLLVDWSERAKARRDPTVVIATAAGDPDTIATAFGEATAVEVVDLWIEGVRRHAPSSALIAEDGPGRLLVVTDAASVDEAKAQAMRIFHGLLDDAGMVGAIVRPAVGIGLALSAMVGYDPDTLLDAARGAAVRATENLESSVVVAV